MKKNILERKYLIFIIWFFLISLKAEYMIVFDLENCTMKKIDEIYIDINSEQTTSNARYLINVNAENTFYKFSTYSLQNFIFIPLKKEISVEIIDQEENKIICNKSFKLNYEDNVNKYEQITQEYSNLEKSIKNENNSFIFKNIYSFSIIIILLILSIVFILIKIKKSKNK
ncbi:MAG: hypothetical protein QXS41_01775 [Candidatus Woesearchaeota archaeon]